MNYAFLLVFLLFFPITQAADNLTDLQHRFESRYQIYLSPSEQNALPFDKLEPAIWKALQASGSLKLLFSKPNTFYLGKTYVFTLYQAGNGSYYLHAKGGFWGMEELAFGPIAQDMLQ